MPSDSDRFGCAQRDGLFTSASVGAFCGGSFQQDLNATWCPSCPRPTHNPGAGTIVQTQLWYRDRLNTSSQQAGFSDAIEFVLGP